MCCLGDSIHYAEKAQEKPKANNLILLFVKIVVGNVIPLYIGVINV
jgi:hypothetical protein